MTVLYQYEHSQLMKYTNISSIYTYDGFYLLCRVFDDYRVNFYSKDYGSLIKFEVFTQ